MLSFVDMDKGTEQETSKRVKRKQKFSDDMEDEIGAGEMEQDKTTVEDIIEGHFEREFSKAMDAEYLDTKIYVHETELKKFLPSPTMKKLFVENKLKFRIAPGSRYSTENIETYILAEKMKERRESIKQVDLQEF